MAEPTINPLHPVPRAPNALKKKKPPPDKRKLRKPARDKDDVETNPRHIDTYA